MVQHKTPSRILTVVIAAVLICGMVASCAQKPETPAELLSLGEKYLSELNYEQAIVQFLKVIEIEPMNVRAYAAAAEIYTKIGQSDKAVELLQKAVELTGDESLKRILEELQPPEQSQEEAPEAEPEPGTEPVTTPAAGPEILKALYESLENDDLEHVREMMQTDEFKEAAGTSTTKEPVLYLPFDGSSGKGLGIYSADYLYFGGYDGNIRSGDGLWMSWTYMGDNIYPYTFRGAWSGDKPNGYGTEETMYTSDSPQYGTYEIITIQTGTLSDGLWDGDSVVNRDTGPYGTQVHHPHYTKGIPTITRQTTDINGQTLYHYAEDVSGWTMALYGDGLERTHGIAGCRS